MYNTEKLKNIIKKLRYKKELTKEEIGLCLSVIAEQERKRK